MKIFLIFLFYLLYSAICTKLVELTLDNYNQVITASNYAVVLFYEIGSLRSSRWENTLNGVIRTLESNKGGLYEKILKEVTFAKVDNAKFDIIGEEYNVDKIPSVKFVHNSLNLIQEMTKTIDSDILNEERILNYLRNKLEPQWTEISSPNELTTLNKERKINIVVCGNNKDKISKYQKEVNEAMPYFDNLSLTIIKNSTLFKENKCANKSADLLLYKKFDEPVVHYSDYKDFNLLEWLDIFTSPVVGELNDDLYLSLMESNHTVFFYIYKDEDSLDMTSYKVFYSLAKKYRTNFLFLKSTFFNAKEITSLFSVGLESLPKVLGIKVENDSILRYKFDGNITKENLDNFVLDLDANQHQPFFISEENNFTNPYYEGSLYKLIRNNFAKEIQMYDGCSVIYFYKGKILPNISSFFQHISNELNYKLENVNKVKIGFYNKELNELPDMPDEINISSNLIMSSKGKFYEYNSTLCIEEIRKFLQQLNCSLNNIPFNLHPKLFPVDNLSSTDDPSFYIPINIHDEINTMLNKVKLQIESDKNKHDIIMTKEEMDQYIQEKSRSTDPTVSTAGHSSLKEDL